MTVIVITMAIILITMAEIVITTALYVITHVISILLTYETRNANYDCIATKLLHIIYP